VIKTVFAQNIDNVNGVATLRGLEGIFENVVVAFLSIATILLFIMLVVGGLKYLTAGGNPKTLEAAKKTLTFCILGIILTTCAFLILRFIEVFTGAGVTNFVITR
jgi:hypothetical protein